MTFRLFLVLLTAQAAGRILTLVVIHGTVPVTGRFLLELLLVTVVQALVLLGLEKLLRLDSRRPRTALAVPAMLSWPALALSYAGAMVSYDLVLHNHLDLTFASYAQMVVVPSVQAFSLAALVSARSWKSSITDLVGVFRRQHFLIFVAIVDAAVVGPAIGRAANPEAGGFPVGALPTYYVAGKALSAGLLTLLCAWRHRGSRAEKIYVSLLGIGLAGYGLDQVFRWIAPLPSLLFPGWVLLFQWLLFYGPLFVAILLLVKRVSDIWSLKSAGAAAWLRAALGFFVLGALIIALDIYNRPVLPPFWAKAVWVAGFCCMSAIWVAVWEFSDTSEAIVVKSGRLQSDSRSAR